MNTSTPINSKGGLRITLSSNCARPRPVLAGLAFASLLLGGCAGGVLPSSGPPSARVFKESVDTVGNPNSTVGYVVVNLRPEVVTHLNSEDGGRLFSNMRGRAKTSVALGIGDVVSITIYEAQRGGLFTSTEGNAAPGNAVELPRQQVDLAGNITVPYAGAIKAAGRSPQDVQLEIKSKLSGRAIDPQVLVSVADRISNSISVLGEVNTPARIPIEPGGIQLLPALARAGGTKAPAFESLISIQREGKIDSALLVAVNERPDNNIQLRPGDVVTVTRRPRYFLAFGATGQTTTLGPLDRRFPFDSYRMSLGDALAKAGGLQDDRAQAAAVFLYRFESRQALERMGVDVSLHPGPLVPTVYRADLEDPSGYFLISDFIMRDRDMIYVSNAPSVDFLKFITLIRSVPQTVSDYRVAAEARF
ncbi:polysaccharide export outer membrane protein [Bradyrhizobium sp. NFR13]|nr:polysaccharide export outer membrane protein [Bradyrhizobium sp. NFR13]